MTGVHFTSADDPRAVLSALRAAMNGSGDVLALGAALPEGVTPPAGTVAVVTTSGSTGIPKSVVLSRGALTRSVMATGERLGTGQWLLALPAAYVAGLQVLTRSLVQGTEPAILSGRFTPDTFIAAAGLMHSMVDGVVQPRYTALVPAQVQTLLDASEDPAVVGAVRSFAAILVGGQALPVAARERATELGWRIVRTYGSTETSGGCVYDGVPLEGAAMRVVDGEVQLGGATIADGYLGDDDLTARSFVTDEDGMRWFRTGDAGAIEDGTLRITGRIDNVLISGGVNVSVDRVERIVREVSGWEGAIVVAGYDERWGQVPVIVAERDVPGALALVRERAGRDLGVAGRPDRVVVVESMPRLTSGKPDRIAAGRMI